MSDGGVEERGYEHSKSEKQELRSEQLRKLEVRILDQANLVAE